MAINKSSISSQSIKENTDITIAMLIDRPDPNLYLSSPVMPNTMVGWYNQNTDAVELWITDRTGYRYIKVQ